MSPEESAPPPSGFAPVYYARLAVNIVRWDDVAIRRASRDVHAIYYGLVIWCVTALVILIFTALPQALQAIRAPLPAKVIAAAFGLLVGLVIMACVTFVQLGLCHLITKWFFSGTGTFAGILRPLLLGWFVNALVLVPVLGTLAASIAWVAVLMLVFEEVEGIERLQAFLISAGINVCFLIVQFMVPMRR
ncbi:MAG TPA: hypothetical protein VMH48_02685 [Methylomirabilota bacterium]|nr:hypothetical protein [Methylomirabilota bacterium]